MTPIPECQTCGYPSIRPFHAEWCWRQKASNRDPAPCMPAVQHRCRCHRLGDA